MSRPFSKNAPCACGSGKKGKSCCGPILDGEPAPTPEALMRSRYSAYATGHVGHLMRTTHPESVHREADGRAWAEELRRYCETVTFTGLVVHAATEDGDRGRVRFTARWTAGGRSGAIEEDSRFRRVDGRWLYLDAEPD